MMVVPGEIKAFNGVKKSLSTKYQSCYALLSLGCLYILLRPVPLHSKLIW